MSAPGGILVDAATIQVTVVDDAGLPIVEVGTAVLELALEARTDVAGWSIFTNVPAGTYTLAVAKVGYLSAAKVVTVFPQESASAVFQLASIPTDAPYHETYGPLPGFFECRAAIRVTASETWTGNCGTVCASSISGCVTPTATTFQNDNAMLAFQLTSPNVRSIIGDMRWTQSSFATSTDLRFALSHEGRDAAHWWCSAQGPTPLFFRYEVDAESSCYNVGTNPEPARPEADHVLRMYANTPFGDEQAPVHLTFEQRFEMVASVFYGHEAPDNFTGLADA